MKRKFLISLFIALILSLTILLTGQNFQALAYAANESDEEKIICSATLEDDFADDKVLLVLSNEESLKFKSYTPKDFPGVDCVKAVDLTGPTVDLVKKQLTAERTGDWSKLKAHVDNGMLVKIENFNRILSVDLKEKSKENVLSAIKILGQIDGVIAAEPDYKGQAALAPNDPQYDYNNLWGLNGKFGINAPAAWDITTGSSAVIVGVMDTGIDGNHPDLKNRIHKSIPHNAQTTLHRDFTTGDENGVPEIIPTDPNGHGTAVSGIIGAEGNNGMASTGVCWNVSLVSLKAFDKDGVFDNSHIVNAISYATAKGIRILNLSGSNDSNFSESQRETFKDYPGLLITAAGNHDIDLGKRPKYPASYDYDNIITVGGSNKNGERISGKGLNDNDIPQGSCFGESVDIYAPGDDMRCIAPGGQYSYVDVWGTSSAAPHVTGVAALIVSLNPALTRDQIKSAILNNADPRTIKIHTSEDYNITQDEIVDQEVIFLNAYKAVNSVKIENTYYTRYLGDGTLEITGSEKPIAGVTVIPSKINGVSVSSIGASAFESCTRLTDIIIPGSVVNIGDGAFSGCTGLYRAELSNYITKIGNDAFLSCVSLRDFKFPEKLKIIGDWAFEGCSGLTDINLPSDLTNIGKYAFSSCYNIVSASVPNKVTMLNTGIFDSCISLEEVSLPNGISTFGNSVFYGCNSLKSLTIPFVGSDIDGTGYTNFGYLFGTTDYEEQNANIPKSLTSVTVTGGNIDDNAFFGCNNIKKITLNGVNKIGARAFFSCYGLNDVAIENTVEKIGDYAFYGCSGLTEITIPGSVEYIGNYAFFYCNRLTDVKIENGVKEIGKEAFIYCNRIESIMIPFTGSHSNGTGYKFFGYLFGSAKYENQNSYIPKSLTLVTVTGGEIFDNAFYGCGGLEVIILPNGLKSVGSYAFQGCESLSEIKIPNTVTAVGAYAFSDCAGLQKVTLQSNLEIIGNYAFRNCVSLNSISQIPNKVKEIGEGAFTGCQNLKSVTLQSALTKIGNYAFKDCVSLTTLTKIPNNVTTIGNGAFEGCRNLGKIEFDGGKLTTLGDYAFKDCSSVTSIKIPSKVTYAGTGLLSGCTKLTTITVDGSSGAYKSVNNCLIQKSGNVLIAVTGNAESITIPSDIQYIGENAFENCVYLTSIIIPDNVISIGAGAFKGCSGLTNVIINGELTKIDERTFYGCTGLTNITLPGSVEEIYEYAFAGCVSLTNIALPDGLRIIWDRAFSHSGLTSLVIPSSVEYIEEYAFSNCVNLISVTMPGGVASVCGVAFIGCINATIYLEGMEYPFENCDHINIRPVITGCTLSADKTYVISFVKTCGSIINSNAEISAPYRSGYTFGGWTTVAGETTAEYSAVDLQTAPDGATLYAIWIAI